MGTSEIRALADEYFEYLSETGPTEAHLRGDYRYADRFEDMSRAAEDADVAALRGFVARAQLIDPTGLSHDDALTREVLIFEAETKAALNEMHMAEFAVDPIFGIQVDATILPPMLSVPTAEVAEAMVGKYRGYGRAFDQLTDRYLEGVASGRVPPVFAVDAVIAQLDEWLALPIDKDPLLNTQVPNDFAEEQTAAYRAALAEVVRDVVRPAIERQRAVLHDDVRPVARPEGQEGLGWLPDGDLVYDRSIHRYTTLPMQAGEIHEIGLQQVARLADEYRALGAKALGTTDLQEIFSRLRDDPDLHHTTGESVRAAAETAFEKARAAMGDWFGRLPEADCVVEETPSGAQAFYFPAAEDGSRPGHVLHEHGGPHVVGHVRGRGHRVSRGHPRPSPAVGDRPGAGRRRPGVPAQCLHRRLRRRVGSLHRTPLRRDGALRLTSRPDGHVVRRLDACRPPRRRHRHSRARLVAPAGDRLPRRELPHEHALDHRRSGPLHQFTAGPGPVLHDRPPRDSADAAPTPKHNSGTASTSRASTMPSSRRGRFRSRHSIAWSRNG